MSFSLVPDDLECARALLSIIQESYTDSFVIGMTVPEEYVLDYLNGKRNDVLRVHLDFTPTEEDLGR